MRRKRRITYAESIREAFAIALARDRRVFLVGEGIPDPKGAFGTTTGLAKTYGSDRVMDMPVSEAGMTGVVIGAAIGGMRPVLAHMRVDFSLYSFDQIVNTAAKWRFMFGGGISVPIVIRMLIGRGWGQGPQHSQSLQALYAHIPGLKVVMPATPADAKGMMLTAIADPNPVVFIEHRWLHGVSGHVPSGYVTVPMGRARIARRGSDITLVTVSYATIEGMRVAEALSSLGLSVEVVDLRSVRPLDRVTIERSVRKTGRMLVVDTGWTSFGLSAEVIASVAENPRISLRSSPVRIGLPPTPTPTSWALAKTYYPTREAVAQAIVRMVGWNASCLHPVRAALRAHHDRRFDTPDPSFTGPF